MARGLVPVVEDAVEIAVYLISLGSALFGQHVLIAVRALSCQQVGNSCQHTGVATIVARQVQHEVLHLGVGSSHIQCFNDAGDVAFVILVKLRHGARAFIVGHPAIFVNRSEVVIEAVDRVAYLDIMICFETLGTHFGSILIAIVFHDKVVGSRSLTGIFS